MIIGEGIEVPREQNKLLRLSTEELQKNYRLRTYHFREDGEGLVTAEGELIATAFTGDLFGVAGNKVYVYNSETSMLRDTISGVQYGPIQPPFQLFRYYDKEGKVQIYCLTPSKLCRFDQGVTTVVGECPGGKCAAVFHERVFIARGERLYYSKALDGSAWSQGRYGSGYLELNTVETGKILNIVPYRERLYLFRESGITSLRVLGDELNFKVEHLPMKCGSFSADSAAMCGEKIGYFTDYGFYLFNGAQSVLAENSRFDEIDHTKPIKAVGYRGRYYAAVTHKGVGYAIYCYDPERRQAHFIECAASDVASGDLMYFVREGDAYVYFLTKSGTCQRFAPYLTAEKLAFGPGEEKMLRSIVIEGEGPFSVTITSNRGSRTLRGKAWEILKLRSPLRGNGFDIKISVALKDASSVRFQAIRLSLTEESNEN